MPEMFKRLVRATWLQDTCLIEVDQVHVTVVGGSLR